LTFQRVYRNFVFLYTKLLVSLYDHFNRIEYASPNGRLTENVFKRISADSNPNLNPNSKPNPDPNPNSKPIL